MFQVLKMCLPEPIIQKNSDLQKLRFSSCDFNMLKSSVGYKNLHSNSPWHDQQNLKISWKSASLFFHNKLLKKPFCQKFIPRWSILDYELVLSNWIIFSMCSNTTSMIYFKEWHISCTMAWILSVLKIHFLFILILFAFYKIFLILLCTFSAMNHNCCYSMFELSCDCCY